VETRRPSDAGTPGARERAKAPPGAVPDGASLDPSLVFGRSNRSVAVFPADQAGGFTVPEASAWYSASSCASCGAVNASSAPASCASATSSDES
jgi:hypothetical protein